MNMVADAAVKKCPKNPVRMLFEAEPGNCHFRYESTMSWYFVCFVVKGSFVEMLSESEQGKFVWLLMLLEEENSLDLGTIKKRQDVMRHEKLF